MTETSVAMGCVNEGDRVRFVVEGVFERAAHSGLGVYVNRDGHVSFLAHGTVVSVEILPDPLEVGWHEVENYDFPLWFDGEVFHYSPVSNTILEKPGAPLEYLGRGSR